MNFKEEIEKGIEILKTRGFNRRSIEAELGYAEKYLDQIIAKGGNEKVLGALKRLIESGKTIGTSKANKNLNPKDTGNFIHVPFVSIRAAASYLSEYGDPIYVENMETIPVFVDNQPHGEYRAFEVKGDSMENSEVRDDYHDRDVILCRKIGQHLWGNKLHINQWDFVIVHKEKGIVLKKIIAHNTETGEITCHSLNPLWEDYIVRLDEVAELYNVIQLVRRSLRS